MRHPLIVLSLTILASCQNYDTSEFRHQPIATDTFERSKRLHKQVPNAVSLECVIDMASYLSPLTDPQVGLGEGGYGVSQAGYATRSEREAQAWHLGLHYCGARQNRRVIPNLDIDGGFICRNGLTGTPCLPWPMVRGATAIFGGNSTSALER